MLDYEENRIKLAETPNPHILLWGRSGQGKTWYCCRKIEEEYEKGHNVWILDYSGSYTMDELSKNKFKYMNDCSLEIYDLWTDPISWSMMNSSEDNYRSDLVDAITAVLDLRSYYQRTILEEAITRCCNECYYFRISKLVDILENMIDEAKLTEGLTNEITNISKLLSRLYPYRKISNLYINRIMENHKKYKPKINIVQLSGYPEHQRQFLTRLMTELMWKNFYSCSDNSHKTIVLDEFQFLGVKPGSPLSDMLREGRKRGIALILSTQFISDYSVEEQETLLQAGNILIFRPSDRDKRFSGGIVDSGNVREWTKILNNLEVGEAVLKGNYAINGNERILHTPIICKI